MRLAVFDLDGTITRRDTLGGYVFGYVRAHPERSWRLAMVPFAAAAFFLDGCDRGRLKERLVRGVLGGVRRAELGPWTAAFIERVLREELCPGAIARVAAHRAAGDHLVLLSASVDLYVPELGQRLGFAETICTQVRWNGDRLDGSLLTPNRRGAEKLRCLEAIRARFPGVECCAYGNDAADLLHLQRVEHGVLVNGNDEARRRAAGLGIPCERWC